jgi:hypothetical protein
MKLIVGKYMPKRMKDDIGQSATFSVGKATGVVFQRVKHTTVLENLKTVEVFVEGWSVVNGIVRPDNTDYFLIPYAFKAVDGHVSIDANMWFVEGNPAHILKSAGLKRGLVKIAGMLHSRFGHVPPAFRPRSSGAIRRKWRATWKATRFKKDFKPVYKSGV